MDESGPDLAAFKSTAQVTGCAMANLVVLKCHLWLNLTEIKDDDKTAFLDSPVSPSGLFGSVVNSFAECFTAAQKTSKRCGTSCRSGRVPLLL